MSPPFSNHELFSNDPKVSDLEPEILNAMFGHPHASLIYITNEALERVRELDKLLKQIKERTPDALKQEIEAAGGIWLYWDPVLEEEPGLGQDRLPSTLVETVTSMILAAILRKLARANEASAWLKSEINTASPKKNDYLLSRAIQWDNYETVELLLFYGADPWKNGFCNWDDMRNTGSFNWDDRILADLTVPNPRFVQYGIEQMFLIMFHLALFRLTERRFHVITIPEGWRADAAASTCTKEDYTGSLRSQNVQDSESIWVHVPENNILLMMAYIRHISWDAALALGRSLEALRRGSSDPLLTNFESSYQSKHIKTPFRTSLPGQPESKEVKCLTTVFPYLMLMELGQQREKRENHKTREAKLGDFKYLLNFDHLDRTLDEAYYPGLSHEALDERNHDQIISHSKDNFFHYDEREKNSGKSDETVLILMVPQLWLYKLGNVVISACSIPPETINILVMEDFIRSRIRDAESGHQPDAGINLGLIITSFVERFGKSYTSQGVHYPRPLDLFETRVVELLSEVRSYIKMPPGGKTTFNGLEYRRERYFMHVISDIRSELAMVQHVLDQQERILKQFLEDREVESVAKWAERWAPVERSQETIREYMRRVEKIDGDAGRIEKSIQDMLNLKRTHASIRDAHSSLIVSTAVIGFTVITIVFTPLAFLTALFALKIDGFANLQVSGSDGVYHRGKIAGVFASTEILTLVLTGVAVWVAFLYINREEEASNSWKGRLLTWWKGLRLMALGVVTRLAIVLMLIAWSRGSSIKKRTKVPDPESPKQDEQPRRDAMPSEESTPAFMLSGSDTE